LGVALADHLKVPAPFAFTSWHQAIDALLALGVERRVPVVIDEFPYLVQANPQLPSIVQNALAPLRPERETSRASLLLCGSAMSFMGRLLSGNAPLRGRAGMELIVPTFDHRLAAEFWGIDDPATALKAHSIVGGTPAYRREFAREDTPGGPGDFDDWVVRTVLSPTSPLFREARYLLAEESGLHDVGIYHSVLAAIASRNTQRGGIASYLGRKSGDLAHPLAVLEDAGLIARAPDVFKDKRTTFTITEPLVTFYHAVMRPIWSDLEHARDTSQLWQRSQQRYASNGPHFEHIARQWTRYEAPAELLGDHPGLVGAGTVNDPIHRTTHELDVVAFALDDDGGHRLLAIGEVKWGETMGLSHLDRLRRIRDLLTAQGRAGSQQARLVCFSGSGFTDDLRRAAVDEQAVALVTLDDLYGVR